MATPAQYLPPALSDETIQSLLSSLDLPAAQTISPLTVTAEYHAIYLLNFPPAANNARLAPARTREPDGSTTLVLRVAGRHLPRIKTTNEVAVMRWVQAHTSVPLPAVVRFDATEANPLGHEFTLLERAPGISVDKVYARLDDAAKHSLVVQLAGFLGEMQAAKGWDAIGGLRLTGARDGGEEGEEEEEEEVAVGQVVDETFWQAPDIDKFWSSTETVASLNVGGPYETYTGFCAAYVEKFLYAIERHESLGWMRDLTPRLTAFRDLLTTKHETIAQLKLNDMKLVLAHKDLHFANIMFEPVSAKITSILDWEFAGVVPASRWDPARAFLWNGTYSDESKAEKERLMSVFAKVCKEKAVSVLEDAKANEYQQAMQTVVSFTRAIVEVCPRGEKQDAAKGWRKMVEEALSKFGL